MKLIALFLSFELHSFMQLNQETYTNTIVKTNNAESKMVSQSQLRKTLELLKHLLDFNENG